MSKSDHHSIPPDDCGDSDGDRHDSRGHVAHFIKDGVIWVKCPKCKSAQPLFTESDDYPSKGFGGPYTVDNAGLVHPEFVCMRHVNVKGAPNGQTHCSFSGVIRLGR